MSPEILKVAVDELFSYPINLASFHDVLAEIECRSYTDQECREAFNKLPEHIKMDALQWGFDTCVCGEAYVFLKGK